jgi:hypothetical protein
MTREDEREEGSCPRCGWAPVPHDVCGGCGWNVNEESTEAKHGR